MGPRPKGAGRFVVNVTFNRDCRKPLNREPPMIALRVLVFSIACALAACGMLPEATFTLSKESRLPGWYHLDPGLSRSQFSVEMSYYISLTGGRTATFVLRRQRGLGSYSVSGKLRGEYPIYLGPPNTDRLHQYPSYEVVTINGVSEAIEHRAMEPVFYISADPAVLNKLGLTATNKQASREKLPMYQSQQHVHDDALE